jgi:outer membrane protein assembly factor BamB
MANREWAIEFYAVEPGIMQPMKPYDNKLIFCFAKSCLLVGLVLIRSSIAMADDWPMRGGTAGRCSHSRESKGPIYWDVGKPGKGFGVTPSQNILWHADGFYDGKGSPVVSQGLVWMGSRNTQGAREMDAGVLTCFRASDGLKVYERVSEKLGISKYGSSDRDWPNNGTTSSPLIEANRLWYCTNRLEVVCLDIEPLIAQTGTARELWTLDLSKQFGVTPFDVHLGSPASRCSIVAYQEWIYVSTTHSIYSGGKFDPSLPSLVCLEKSTGKLKWADNSPGENLVLEPHANPTIIDLKDRALVAIGQGDGWLRAFDCETGRTQWQFNMNDRTAKKRIAKHRALRVVESPAFDGERLIVVAGERYEVFADEGRIVALDPRRSGDISTVLINGDGDLVPNPNSGSLWEHVSSEEDPLLVCVGGAAVDDRFVFVTSIAGDARCYDKRTGELYWRHDLHASSYSTPLIVGDQVYFADADGDVEVLRASKEYEKTFEASHPGFFDASPIFANGTLFLQSQSSLWAIRSDLQSK